MRSITPNQALRSPARRFATQLPSWFGRCVKSRGHGSLDRRRTRQCVRQSWTRALLWILVVGVALLIAALGFVYLSPSYNAYIIRSESMKPAIDMGDMIIVGPDGGIFSKDIAPGTIVTYRMENAVVTHRVLSIDGQTILTKGDAVKDPDPQRVPISQVLGVVILTIPKLGFVSAFLHSKPAWLLLIIGPAIILLVVILREIIIGYKNYACNRRETLIRNQ